MKSFMKKINFFCDPMTVAMATIYYGISTIWVIILIIIVGGMVDWPNIWNTEPIDNLYVYMLLVIMLMISLGIYVICFPKWYRYVTIDKDGVCINNYKKRNKIAHEKYRFFYVGYYSHIFTKRCFLVISITPISRDKLSRVNTLEVSGNCVKIKLTKTRYSKLMDILPADQQKKLELAVCNQNLFDIDSYFKIKNKKKKKAKKRK